MNRSTTTLAMLALAACNAPMEGDGPDEARLDAPVSFTHEQELRGDRDGIIVGNALSTEQLMFSTLLTTPGANEALTRNPLNASSFASEPALRNALVDPWSQEVLSYIAGCALEPTRSFTAGGRTYRGQAGLCTRWGVSAAGERMTAACQELVSACVLARNNHLGWHVPLSMRGDDTVGGDQLKVGGNFDGFDWRSRFTPVLSLQNSCGTVQWGARRNCGWSANRVFKCTPGASVTVAAGAPAYDACTTTPPLGAVTSGDMVLRMCDGIAGCDNASALDWSEGYECPSYRYKPTLTATCPSSGFVNVMAAPYVSTATGSVALDSLGAVQAQEQATFPVREGNFYGTLFDWSVLPYTAFFDVQTGVHSHFPAVGPVVVFPKMFACADPAWVSGADYIARPDARDGRVCATGNCAANPTGLCNDTAQAACTEDATGDGEYRRCKGGGVEWTLGLTTFLRSPCDLTKDPNACLRN